MGLKASNRTRQAVAQARTGLLVLGVGVVLLALWLGWTGWRQMQDATRRDDLARQRDHVVDAVGRALAGERQRLGERLASPEVREALAAGDLARAAEALGRDWPGLEHAAVYPPDLADAYGAVSEAGYGRIAVAEAAVIDDGPVLGVVRDGGRPALALAAPARVDDALVGIAYVRLPVSRVTEALDAARVPGATYLALRQGGYTVAATGDEAFAESAERMAQPVEGSRMRVAAGLPPKPPALFGLGVLASFIAALVLALLGYVLARLPSLLGAPAEEEEGGASPTLEEALELAPAGETPAAATVAEAPVAPPVAIDPGIFRAYDIRGIVGQSLDAGIAELIGQAIG